MARNLVCSECGGTMQMGYIPDFTYSDTPSNIKQTFWVEGKMERSFWGIQFKGKKRYFVTAYRCESCGFIKFYAGPNNSTGNRQE